LNLFFTFFHKKIKLFCNNPDGYGFLLIFTVKGRLKFPIWIVTKLFLFLTGIARKSVMLVKNEFRTAIVPSCFQKKEEK